jgi:phosphoglycolate phosphatase
MAYQTILFDLDGTLTDPLLGFARSINYALEAHGLETQTQQHLAQYVGPPLEGTLSALTGHDDQMHIAALVAKYRERYLDIGYAENTVYPSVRETLQSLQSAGQRMAVCTSKPERTARMVLELFELDGFFEFVSGGDVGVAKWMQIEKLKADDNICDRTVMIGDRAIDLSAGHRNDVFAGGVLWGYGARLELAAESPAHLFEQPSDWLSLLD